MVHSPGMARTMFTVPTGHFMHIPSWMARTILTSTKNASLIITDFLVMIYKNEQPRTASLCSG